MSIEATVTLRSKDISGVGRDRIRLLQAVAREGSITAGAKAAGLSYKAAWDALDAMTNLFGQPLLETRTGGQAGGGAALTPTGLRVIEAFGRLEAEMARVFRTLEPDLAGTGISPLNLVSGFFMKTSARNALRGTDDRHHVRHAERRGRGRRSSAETTIYALRHQRERAQPRPVRRPRGDRADQGAVRADRAGPRGADGVGAQLRARRGPPLRHLRRQCRGRARHRRRQDAGRLDHRAQRRRRSSCPPAIRPARCSTPRTSSSPSTEPAGDRRREIHSYLCDFRRRRSRSALAAGQAARPAAQTNVAVAANFTEPAKEIAAAVQGRRPATRRC